jgi:hypothetical protein
LDCLNPRDSTYLWWQKNPDSCNVKFWRDSLSVVGGSLSVVCVGALNEIPNIDNRFSVNTDSVVNDTMRATKLIIVDQDPANALFEDTLRTDRIRAVAWQEYAGSSDTAHCHEGNTYNPRWNHYWDTFVSSQGDTCFDTRFPCENAIEPRGTDTGIMQIVRQGIGWGWGSFFERADSWPTGYFRASWDSLSWNWQLNIFNGKYIHDIYYPAKFTAEQRSFPDSCPFSDCGSFPAKKNKEDLKSYGYHAGEQDMKKIVNDSLWKEIICDTIPPIREDADYVQKVRGFYYGKPW